MSTKRWANFVSLHFVQTIVNSITDLPFKKDRYYKEAIKDIHTMIEYKQGDYTDHPCSAMSAGAISRHVIKEWIITFEYKREFLKNVELPSSTRINLDFTYKTILKSLYRKQKVCKRQARQQ